VSNLQSKFLNWLKQNEAAVISVSNSSSNNDGVVGINADSVSDMLSILAGGRLSLDEWDFALLYTHAMRTQLSKVSQTPEKAQSIAVSDSK
jgi:hypothetical protein